MASGDLEASGDTRLVQDIVRLTDELYEGFRDLREGDRNQHPKFTPDEALALTKEAIGPLVLRIQRKRLTAGTPTR